MLKTKKILISLLTVTLVTTPIATMVSCGKSSIGDPATHYAHDRADLRYLYPTTTGENPYKGQDYRFIPRNLALGSDSLMHELVNATLTGAVKTEVNGFPEYDRYGNLKPGTEKTSEKLVLEVAKQIEVNYLDGGTEKTHIITNENINNFGVDILSKMNGGSPIVIKSINIAFPEKGEGAKWVKYGTGAFAIDETGQPMEVSAEDYWYSIMNTIYTNSADREAEISSDVAAVINPIAKDASFGYAWSLAGTSTSASTWTTGGSTAYGLDLTDFKDAGDVGQNSFTANNKVNFKFNNPSNIQVRKFWDDMFKMSGGLKILSAKQVKDSIKEVDSATSGPQKDLKDALEQIKNTKTYKYGAYQLRSQKWDKSYTAGEYYLSSFNGRETKVVRNQNYILADQWWANARKVNSFAYDFINSATYDTAGFTNFKQGTTYTATFRSEEHKREAQKDEEKYGVVYTKGYTANKTVVDYTGLLANPIGTSNFEIDKNFNYYFTEDFSKAMWGGTIDDFTAAAPTPEQLAIRQKGYKHFFAGKGFQLRSAMRAMHNEYHSTLQYNRGLQDWGSRFAPELEVKASDVNSDFISYKLGTGDSAYNPFNEKQFFGVDASGVITKKGNIKREQYINWSDTAPTSDQAFGAPVADKTKLIELIEDSLTSSGLTGDSKIMFEFPIGRGMTTKTVNVPVYQPTVDIYNGLISDATKPKFDIVAQVTPHKAGDGKDALVKVQEFTDSFEVLNESNKPAWIDRLYGYGGTGAFSINPLAATYAIQSPSAPLLQNIGYLQDGMLFAYSHAYNNGYAAVPELAPIKLIGTILNDAFESEKNNWTTWSQDTSAAKKLTSSIASVIWEDLSSISFGEFIDSDMTEVAKFDYIGLKGFEKTRAAILAAKAAIPAKPADDASQTDKVAYNAAIATYNAVKRDYNTAQGFFNEIFQKVLYGAEATLEALPLAEQMKIYDAFDELAPFHFNVTSMALGNRNAPSASLRKSFVQQNIDQYKMAFIGNWKINK